MTQTTDPPADLARHGIADVAELTGCSIDTLRYYERAGVLPDIARSDTGQRRYSDDDVGWVAFVRRLRATGMPMRRVEEYTSMVRAGDGTLAERRRLLEEHRATVASAIDELDRGPRRARRQDHPLRGGGARCRRRLRRRPAPAHQTAGLITRPTGDEPEMIGRQQVLLASGVVQGTVH